MLTFFSRPQEPLLQAVPDKISSPDLVYQLAVPFQVSPGAGALSVNLRQAACGTVDFEGGANLVLLGPGLAPIAHVPVTRTTVEPHPRTGKPTHMVRFPMIPGFVPAGEGPNGGTGFAIGQVIGYPAESPVRFSGEIPAEDRYHALELVQLSWQDGELRASQPERIGDGDLIRGWDFQSQSIGPALPDGDGFLMGFTARNEDGQPGTGVMRWGWEGGAWRPLSFTPVSGDIETFEPSIIRDVDGTLLLTARGRGDHAETLRVWESTDGGASWQLTLNVHQLLAATPVSINMGPGGQPYIAGNPKRELDSLGRSSHSIEMREKLWIWPLAADRQSLLEPIEMHDLADAFGPAPNGSIWRADHPLGATLQLGDDKPRHWLFYRVLEQNECISDAPVTHRTGTFAQEILSSE